MSAFSALSRSCVLALALLSANVAAKEPEREIQAVIIAQVIAFADDDAAAAWQLASDGIQQQFGSPDLFLAMVRFAYPAIYRAASVQFGELIPHPGFAVQTLVIIGPDGRYWDSFYTMVEQDGRWRIGGVFIEEVAPGI